MATRTSARWVVALKPDPFSVHHWSIWCGLTDLHARGLIDLVYNTRPAPVGRGLWLDVHDRDRRERRTIWVDVSDRAPVESARRHAADSSWVRNAVEPQGRPLGPVAPMRSGLEPRWLYLGRFVIDAARTRRPNDVRRSLSGLLRGQRPLLRKAFEAPPGGEPRVVFQVRAWEPHDAADSNHRRRVNDHRAELIRLLKREFGNRFIGGFQPSAFAASTYPDLLTTSAVDQVDYLRMIQRNAIVISSTGLHGSIPWKVAEYLAAARAIVSEPILNRLPFSIDGTVDLFATPDDCITKCDALLADPVLRATRQQAARDLWLSDVRPDRLVLRRLHDEFDELPVPAGSPISLPAGG